MMKHDICCIGHITHDKIITPNSSTHLPGGTAYYFANGIKLFLNDCNFILLTSVGENDLNVIDKLRESNINVSLIKSKNSVYFENIYSENINQRTQRVLAKADPFTINSIRNIESNIFHLGSLLFDDFPLDLVKYLSSKGLISIDSQGYLREVRNEEVYAVDWNQKLEYLKVTHFLKVNEYEMEVLTKSSNIETSALILYEWGAKEVIITLGNLGSVIFDGKIYYIIPAYHPKKIVDTTGCGDTYMCGYLYQRSKGKDIQSSGEFAAAMSSIKLEGHGPFQGTKEDILICIQTYPQTIPQLKYYY